MGQFECNGRHRFGSILRRRDTLSELPGAVIGTEELGRAMLRVARQGASKGVLESRDLRSLGAP